MIADILERVGGRFGNQREYLVCDECSADNGPWVEVSPETCECGGPLSVVVPNSEALVIRYVCWKSDQRWLPQRYFRLGDEAGPGYRYWAWLGREWLRRPWAGLGT